MLGDSLLIVPKLRSAAIRNYRDVFDDIESLEKKYPVDFYLPSYDTNDDKKVGWYDYKTKMLELESGFVKNRLFSIRDMPVFVKTGSIIPIKLHYNRLSLIRAYL